MSALRIYTNVSSPTFGEHGVLGNLGQQRLCLHPSKIPGQTGTGDSQSLSGCRWDKNE